MYGEGPRRRARWPRSRPLGCLLWLLILVVVLVILSVMFGGFQKGSKANGLPAPPALASARAAPADGHGAPGAWRPAPGAWRTAGAWLPAGAWQG